MKPTDESKDPGTRGRWSDPGYQSYMILRAAYILIPLIAGLDKFAHLLTDWDAYIAPWAVKLIHGKTRLFMMAVGVFEVVLAIGHYLKPRYFVYGIALWMITIVVNLVTVYGFYDIALRDFGLAMGALALARLSHKHAPEEMPILVHIKAMFKKERG